MDGVVSAARRKYGGIAITALYDDPVFVDAIMRVQKRLDAWRAANAGVSIVVRREGSVCVLNEGFARRMSALEKFVVCDRAGRSGGATIYGNVVQLKS